MRQGVVAAAVAGAMLAGCATAPDPAAVRREIEAAEAAWTHAVAAKDMAALERLMAPEFALRSAGSGQTTPRAAWLANLNEMTISEYVVRVTDVRAAGDTAVADVEGEWTVARGARQSMRLAFQLRDTWVRREGRWQVTERLRVEPPPGR